MTVKSNWTIFVSVCVGAVLGFAVGQHMGGKAAVTPAKSAQAQANTAAGAPPGSDVIYKVRLGDAPQKGDSDAKVTIVEWSDFQCPFCGRVIPTVQQIEKTYGRDVRIVFKQNPLPMHGDALPAARAALAAQKQGKFWEMHDKLFEANQSRQPDALKQPKLEQMARDIGLDMTRFQQDFGSPELADIIHSDQAQANALGAHATPSFFINGAPIQGAYPLESFKIVIDRELKRANDALAKGVARKDLYEYLIKDGRESAPTPPPPPPPPAQARNVDVGDGPSLGGKQPKVTIVEWSDFQCPFCGRVEPTIKQVLDTYKGDVKLVWRNQPLPMHQNAVPAAKAAMAAYRQGNDKFWKMHDLMFQHQTELTAANFEAWAKEAGVNLAKWNQDKDSPELAAEISKDASYGSSVGADGTPAFFINGRFISGAMPFEQFKTVIDEQIKKADELLKKGTPHAKLYETLVAENVKSAGSTGGGDRVTVEAGNSPAKGDRKAPVTIVEWSDFQCPFCSRVEPTLNQLVDEYKGKVKLVWKNQPLPFHPNAMPAAEAAMAAYEQGSEKFWQMHDKFFQNQGQLSPQFYDQVAQEIGLDMKKFHASLDAHKPQAAINADMSAGNALGASGTPTFFINGRKLVGAVSIDQFKAIVDDELASAAKPGAKPAKVVAHK